MRHAAFDYSCRGIEALKASTTAPITQRESTPPVECGVPSKRDRFFFNQQKPISLSAKAQWLGTGRYCDKKAVQTNRSMRRADAAINGPGFNFRYARVDNGNPTPFSYRAMSPLSSVDFGSRHTPHAPAGRMEIKHGPFIRLCTAFLYQIHCLR